jgi:hypothetical protein
MKKLAVIRQDGRDKCPFGLPIKEACESAGRTVLNMLEIKSCPADEREEQTRVNNQVFNVYAEGKKCIFADKILEKEDMVHCDYREGGEGISDYPMLPSPYYPRLFNGLPNQFSGPLPSDINNPNGLPVTNMEAQQFFNSSITMYASKDNLCVDKLSFDEFESFYHSFFKRSGG